jgi:hypothetical protein
MTTYELKKYTLEIGRDAGKSHYVVMQDGAPVLYTDPLTVEESLMLRSLANDPRKMRAWIDQQQKTGAKTKR